MAVKDALLHSIILDENQILLSCPNRHRNSSHGRGRINDRSVFCIMGRREFARVGKEKKKSIFHLVCQTNFLTSGVQKAVLLSRLWDLPTHGGIYLAAVSRPNYCIPHSYLVLSLLIIYYFIKVDQNEYFYKKKRHFQLQD